MNEYKVYSQNGEDGVIDELTKDFAPGVALEIGFCNTQANTILLAERGWTCTTVDVNPTRKAQFTELVLPETIGKRAGEWGVPLDLDFFSLDIDGQDLYVVGAFLFAGFRPRVMCLEYNAVFGLSKSVTVPLDPNLPTNKSDYFGASLRALTRTAERFGYMLVYCERAGVNAFYTQGVAKGDAVAEYFRPVNYKSGSHPHKDGVLVEVQI